jgi:hypothetical protein
MADAPEKPPATPPTQTGYIVKDPANAPFIFFEAAPAFGNANGIVNVTLVASRHLLSGTLVTTDVVAVAHLRCSVPAAMALRNALDRALLLGAKTEGGVN